jgi:hypothetical protein
MTFLDQIKLYHWQTKIYSRHKATDDLHSELSRLVDNFIETLHGIIIYKHNNYRIKLFNNTSIILNNLNDTDGLILLSNIKIYLESNDLKRIINNNSDLLNIKDEMLNVINKFTYLFTLS